MPIPTLAGLCTYEEAARPGYSVADNVARMLRYAWIEKRAMETKLYWINPTPEWEVKEALSLHLYQDADHARLFRERIGEMRNPPPRMDVSPDERIDRFFEELWRSADTLEKLVGLYGFCGPRCGRLPPALQRSNPCRSHDAPLLRFSCWKRGHLAWAAPPRRADRVRRRPRAGDAWAVHLRAYLDAAGGIMAICRRRGLCEPRATEPFQPDFFPRRDERFTGQWNFVFPPHEVARTPGVPVEEKTLALMCKRTLEMDVPEAMARMIAEAQDMPWAYYVDMCRQLWERRATR